MLKLSNEQKALLSLLGKEEGIESDIDWEKVEMEAMQQAVYLQAAGSTRFPKAITWGRTLQYAIKNAKSLYAVIELNRIMGENNFRYVILKGLSSSAYYPKYECRILGDCDFLIQPEQKEQVKEVLLSAGYEMSGEGNNHHTVFRRPNQDLEMHFEIPGIPNGWKGNCVRDYMSGVFDESLSFEIQGRNICLPLPKYHGLILLLHMQHHMLSEGIGLRHLFDWCMFVEKTFTEDFWERDLLPILKKIGLFRFAQIMTKTGNLYLGTICPEWCQIDEEALCDCVMEDILTGGNFGRKNKARSAAGMMISRPGTEDTKRGRIYHLWKSMVGGVKGYHYHTLKKYPILYPLFMTEFVMKRIWNVCTGKKSSLFENCKYVNERKSVYDRLKIFETD